MAFDDNDQVDDEKKIDESDTDSRVSDLSMLRHWMVEPNNDFRLGDVDPTSTPGAPGDRAATEAACIGLRLRLNELQTRLRAEERRSVLLVLQAMDAGGKDGTVKSVFREANPMSLEITSFDVPSKDELRHDFLWRVHGRLPARGHIGIFNRSHYEDVLVVRVKNLVPEAQWKTRYDTIKRFEEIASAEGTTFVKIMLHISPDEQRHRLQERIDEPGKRWKFRLGDLDDRKLWHEFQEAYEAALKKTSTADAPWFCVPGDRKWYRNWAVLMILVTTLENMNPQYPEFPEYDGLIVQ